MRFTEHRLRRALFALSSVVALSALAGVMSPTPANALISGEAQPPAATSAAAPHFAGLIPSTFHEVYNFADIPLSGVQSVTAECPPGEWAVSIGGGGTPLGSIAPGTNGSSAVATTSSPRPNLDWDINTEVSCAPASQFAGTTVITGEQPAKTVPGGRYTRSLECPAGMRAFGGGGYFRTASGALSTTGEGLIANSVTNQGKVWRVVAVDKVLTDVLVVVTRCAPQSSSTRLMAVSYLMQRDPVTGVKSAGGYAECPPGYRPISGGAIITSSAGDETGRLNWSVPSLSSTLGWYAEGTSNSAVEARLNVIVLCGT
jgi:hypothetical protein